MDEKLADAQLLNVDNDQGIMLADRSKCMGLFSALCEPNDDENPDARPRRVITYCNTVKRSKSLTDFWLSNLAKPHQSDSEAIREVGQGRSSTMKHVDGKMSAFQRQELIAWLEGDASTEHCNLLSNVQVLSEGVDVPALDAIAFMDPRTSYIQIVQSVGRVMRKPRGVSADSKKCGYIVIPVAMSEHAEPAKILDKNNDFKTVWRVLNALRSHDEHLDSQLNAIDLNQAMIDRLIMRKAFDDFGKTPADSESDSQPSEPGLNLVGGGMNIPLEMLIAKIAEQCADTRYWEHWVTDIANIFDDLKGMVQTRLDKDADGPVALAFQRTAEALGRAVGKSVGEERALDIVAQHILVRRIFNAIFPEQDFLRNNLVARALERLTIKLLDAGLKHELALLDRFYKSVERNAGQVTTKGGKQALLKKVYEEFIKRVFAKEAEALGVVYTPNDIVNFMIRSVDSLLAKHFDGERLTDTNVHVLDPFTGTGTFIVQLLHSGLIKPGDLLRKFDKELHANEIMLLPYYIALLNISNAFAETCQQMNVHPPMSDGAYSFRSLNYVNSFSATSADPTIPSNIFGTCDPEWQETAITVQRQRSTPIRVIMSNPPWRMGQKNVNDFNPNEVYTEIDRRIANTYAKHSSARLKRGLYDQYKRAVRWASDRIGERGIIAFVTNESWYTKWSNDGLRKCLAEEFDEVGIVHLGGNVSTAQSEGENVFNIKTGVTVMFLVKGSCLRTGEEAFAHVYRLPLNKPIRRHEKLAALRDIQSIEHADVEPILVDSRHEWYERGDASFNALYPIGDKKTKAGRGGEGLLQLYGLGFTTGQGTNNINFDPTKCAKRGAQMIQAYNAATKEIREEPDNWKRTQRIMSSYSNCVSWNRDMRKKALRGTLMEEDATCVRMCTIAPFTRAFVYFNRESMQVPGLIPRMFPYPDTRNSAIVVTAAGAGIFGVFATDISPDLGAITGSQVFVRDNYLLTRDARSRSDGRWSHGLLPRSTERDGTLDMKRNGNGPTALRVYRSDRKEEQNFHSSGVHSRRGGDGGCAEASVDNVTDAALIRFREHYDDQSIVKDDIFCYIYGILHAPDYCKRYSVNLKRDLPRIPLAPQFRPFVDAGARLMHMHINYEEQEEYLLTVTHPDGTPYLDVGPDDWRIDRQMRRIRNKDTNNIVGVHINGRVDLRGIPADANQYKICGFTPIEYAIRKLEVSTNSSGDIINDPNNLFEEPDGIRHHLQRLVYISIESARIIRNLPPALLPNTVD